MELLQTPQPRRQAGDGRRARSRRRRSATRSWARSSASCSASAIAFLWETLDKRVRTEEEIERRLGLPLLSRLPEPARGAEKEARLTMIHDPQDAYAEAVRRLRTNLEFANVDRDARVIMVTSAVEREGKSTTIANLAVALARSGRNVALVDLDLRQPVLAKYFELQGQPGITDVVLERADLQTTITPIRLPDSRLRLAQRQRLRRRSRSLERPSDRTAPCEPGRARRHTGARPGTARAPRDARLRPRSTPPRSSRWVTR